MKGNVAVLLLIVVLFISTVGIIAVIIFNNLKHEISQNPQKIINSPVPILVSSSSAPLPVPTPTNFKKVHILEISNDIDSGDGIVLDKAAKLFYSQHADNYDFLVFFPGFKPKKDLEITAQHLRIQNNVRGICMAIEQPNIEKWGSRKLKGVSSFPYGNSDFKEWIDNPNASGYLLLHETGHQWLTSVGQPVTVTPMGQLQEGINRSCGETDLPLQYSSNDYGHWSKGLQMPAGSAGVMIGGLPWVDNGNDTYAYDTSISDKPRKFHPFDLYLMGLIGPKEVAETYLLLSDVASLEMPGPPVLGAATNLRTISSKAKKLTINDIIKIAGEPRNPDAEHSQKDFSIAFIILKKPDQSLSDTLVKAINQAAQVFPQQWAYATDNHSSMDVR